ncbi:hypothetical protein [Pseudomonas frederiksbergensis]|nr:hypothetical protein [Pseudomonas frederiksbergensis]
MLHKDAMNVGHVQMKRLKTLMIAAAALSGAATLAKLAYSDPSPEKGHP